MSAPIGMTPYRARILTLAANGHTNAAIGARLGITANAVNLQLQEIYQVLGASSRTHAVALGIRYGHVDAGQVQPRAGRPGAHTREEVAA